MENVNLISGKNIDIPDTNIDNGIGVSNKIQYLLLKHMKEKKRHEIKLFAQVGNL